MPLEIGPEHRKELLEAIGKAQSAYRRVHTHPSNAAETQLELANLGLANAILHGAEAAAAEYVKVYLASIAPLEAIVRGQEDADSAKAEDSWTLYQETLLRIGRDRLAAAEEDFALLQARADKPADNTKAQGLQALWTIGACYQVLASAGWEEAPTDLAQAVSQLVAERDEAREQVLQLQEKLEGGEG